MSDFLTASAETLGRAFWQIVAYVGSLLPTILAAVVILVLGWFVADWIGRLVRRLLQKMYLDQMFDRLGFEKTLKGIGVKIELSKMFGLLVTWFMYAVVLVATADLLGLTQISLFLNEVVLYIPNIIIAVVILVVGIILGSFLQTLVVETTRAANIEAGPTLARLSKWAVVVFAGMAALVQLRVAAELIQILFTGFIFMIALAGGIAFGLGGKDVARQMVEKLARK